MTRRITSALAALAVAATGLVLAVAAPAQAVSSGYYRLAHNGAVYAVDSSGRRSQLSYDSWLRAGSPTPQAAPTDYVKYPWSATVYAVTFWESDSASWDWDRLDLDEWTAAGRPAPRSAGWIAGSRYFQSGRTDDLYVRAADETVHRLTYAEWSASGFRAPQTAAQVGTSAVGPWTAAVPAWWSGWCNSDTNPGSYQLSAEASLFGVVPCGGGRGRVVRFFPDASGELEWQCVEFAARFMHLVYGTVPYLGNGSQVVWNYDRGVGGGLVAVPNGIGYTPRTGDVISFGPTSTNGHVAVVASSSVNSSGNGTVRIVEQNYSSSGVRTLAVSGWTVSGGATGWLHRP